MAVDSINSNRVAESVRQPAQDQQARQAQAAERQQRQAEEREAQQRTERQEAAPRPVVNAQGQATGTLINVTA